MTSLVKRHLLVFVRDKWSVFFSLLSVIIVILLYTLFLIQMHESGLPDAMQGTTEAKHLTYTWLFSGVLMVSTVTVPLGFLGIMIRDKTEKISNDFYVTPLKRLAITLSYLIAAFVITVILGVFNLAVGQVIVYLNASEWLSALAFLKVLALTALSSALFTAMLYTAVSFLKTQNAHGTMSSIIGTLVGFLAGLYVPIGSFGESFQTFLSLTPFMQVSALFRTVYMEQAIGEVFQSSASQTDYALFFGIDLELFGATLSQATLTFIILGWTVLFILLASFRVKSFRT
ncbi:MAG: ABC transporter permease [Bacillota bacterium]